MEGNDFLNLISEKATKLYRDVLGAQVSSPQDLPDHGVTAVFVSLPNTKLEVTLLIYIQWNLSFRPF